MERSVRIIEGQQLYGEAVTGRNEMALTLARLLGRERASEQDDRRREGTPAEELERAVYVHVTLPGTDQEVVAIAFDAEPRTSEPWHGEVEALARALVEELGPGHIDLPEPAQEAMLALSRALGPRREE